MSAKAWTVGCVLVLGVVAGLLIAELARPAAAQETPGGQGPFSVVPGQKGDFVLVNRRTGATWMSYHGKREEDLAWFPIEVLQNRSEKINWRNRHGEE